MAATTSAKKTTPPRASVAARREVRAEKNPPKPMQVTFRGVVFELPQDRLGSARVFQRMKLFEQFPTNENGLKVVYELLGASDAGRFIDLLQAGEGFEPIGEFIDAFNKAANVPNS